ncbi:hypothetical protein CHRYSEO8AT_560111 [Chryseobacterium sp. 8AT]|nr:hypothetical protein CHRYSEO8AT_560111 [Chryseobacterium sp. 8AT]
MAKPISSVKFESGLKSAPIDKRHILYYVIGFKNSHFTINNSQFNTLLISSNFSIDGIKIKHIL